MLKKGMIVMFILSFALVGLLAACSNNASNEKNTSKSTSETDNESGNKNEGPAEPEEPITISIARPGAYPTTDGTPGQVWLEEKFNIKIDNLRIERSSWQEQLNLLLASGDIPDIIWLFGAGDLLQYADQGILAELPTDEIKKYMPNYSAMIDDVYPAVWDYAKVDGIGYAVPTVLGGIPDGPMPIYRGDWLENAGYDRAPETLEELEEVLYSFSYDDPNQSGKKDTFGISSANRFSGTHITAPFNIVFGAHQINVRGWNFDDDDQLVYGMVTEKAREAFKVLNKWFEDGVIDPEFITTDRADIWDGVANGRYGMSDAENYIQHYKSGQFGTRFEQKGIEAISGKPVSGPYGEGRVYASYPMGNFIGLGVHLQEDERKKQKIYELLEALASDEETYIMARHGIEGVHYEMKDGDLVRNPEYTTDKFRAEGYMAYDFYYGKSPKLVQFDMATDQYEFGLELMEGVAGAYNEVLFPIPIASDYPDMEKIGDEYFLKFIVGEVDLDQGFDKFVETWYNSGGKQITDQVNQIYDENYR